MKGTRSHRLALSIISVLLVAAGLFISLSIYASNLIWPDPADIMAEYSNSDLPEPPAETAEMGVIDQPLTGDVPDATPTIDAEPSNAVAPDVVATVNQPEMPDTKTADRMVSLSRVSDKPIQQTVARLQTGTLGRSLRRGNDIADLMPRPVAEVATPVFAATTDGSQIFSAFPLGTAENDPSPAPPVIFDLGLATKPPSRAVDDDRDADYELDMRVAALAQPINGPTPTPAPTPAEFFVLASDAPKPLPETVFALAATGPAVSIWPQRVDHDAVLAVSRLLDAPDTGDAPTINATIAPPDLRKAPTAIAAPDLQLAAVTGDLQSLPPQVASLQDEDLARDIAKVLAAIPIPLPGAQTEQDAVASLVAPEASPRPLRRVQTAPKTPPRADQRTVEPHPPLVEAKVAEVMPASEPAVAPVLPADGRERLSVVGIFQTDAAAWALLEFSDGRIIKATKGTTLGGIKVARIRGDKIWFRDGGSEKGLTTGQVIVLD
ncbi:hypothetical protein MUY35_12505 [Aliiroseovarius sp. S1339]|uniref:hypothetical protein n=1 Tax=Aliiroseovarius sp. S1339 TaxID=2936990 RepID=UPI0020BF07D8|nr:hypothetical protein [Aliiroseovarius sp. S1339]MCK8464674.1 hypothetical protein [Aliiroseovarius sp. S1339]